MRWKLTYKDAFNLLCGDRLGEGTHRIVYTCRIRTDLVVKVEREHEYRQFSNVMEEKFWSDHQYYEKVSRWLAPCEFLSPDGRILLQRRATPLSQDYQLPNELPAFLTDHKRENFGLLDGRLVSVDYAITIPNPSTRLRRANW